MIPSGIEGPLASSPSMVSLRRWLLVRGNLFAESQGSQRVIQTESVLIAVVIEEMDGSD
jgi:hypothetical protein